MVNIAAGPDPLERGEGGRPSELTAPGTVQGAAPARTFKFMAPPTDPPLDIPGLASGPGPTPPGFDDGTPHADRVEPGEPGAAERQRDAGEVAERSAGVRQGELSEDAGDGQPEEQQPDEG